jgi:anaerobic magnesium-protoporphyrin IX monomethyl ester cyclase
MKIAFCIAEDINLSAGYIISYLKKEGHDVRLFFDPKQFERGYSRNSFLASAFDVGGIILNDIRAFNPEMVCFSVVTAHYQWALALAMKIKERIPKTKIIFGGIHPTLCPEEVRKNSFIDEVVVGCGIKYFGGQFDPDKLFPDREIFLKELPPEHRKVQLFMTGFGCPFNCSYCGNEQLRKAGQHKLYRRSVDGCIEELKQLKERGMKYVLFVDDIFTIDRDWLNNFILRYVVSIRLPFSCFIHPKFIDKDIVKALKEGGCQSAWLGIQTGFEPLRKEILNRHETNIEIIECCKLIKEAKIKLIIDHIFGIPFESEISNDISQSFYELIKPDIVNCYQLLYFPKAGIIQHGLRSGDLSFQDIENINEGKGIIYQTNNKGQKFYDTYMKSMICVPLGGIIFEFLPAWLIKIINLFRAGRGFTIWACLQNEIYFSFKIFIRKL